MLQRLIDANLSGLGFGVGFGFKQVPAPWSSWPSAHDFPLFEVPYNIPFIAITEAVASKIVNEQYSLLQRSLAVHEKLTKIVLEEKGLQFIISTLSALVGCSAVLFDFHGVVLCEAAHRRRIRAELIADLWKADLRQARLAPGLLGRAAARRLGAACRSTRWWPRTASAPSSPSSRTAASSPTTTASSCTTWSRVTALELVKKKAVAETEKRLAGDFFDELIASDLYEEEIARRLAFFGLEPQRRAAHHAGRHRRLQGLGRRRARKGRDGRPGRQGAPALGGRRVPRPARPAVHLGFAQRLGRRAGPARASAAPHDSPGAHGASCRARSRR